MPVDPWWPSADGDAAPAGERAKTLFSGQVDAAVAASAATAASAEADRAARRAQERAEEDGHLAAAATNRAADVANLQSFFEVLSSFAIGSVERARAGAELVQKAAGAIATLYAGVLALVFSVSDNPLPARGVLAPAFLGLAVVLSTAYIAYLGPAIDVTAAGEPVRGLEPKTYQRLNIVTEVARGTALLRSAALRASVIALGVGLAYIVLPFVTLTDDDRSAVVAADQVTAWPSPQVDLPDPLDAILYQAQVDEASVARKAQATPTAGDDSGLLLGRRQTPPCLTRGVARGPRARRRRAPVHIGAIRVDVEGAAQTGSGEAPDLRHRAAGRGRDRPGDDDALPRRPARSSAAGRCVVLGWSGPIDGAAPRRARRRQDVRASPGQSQPRLDALERPGSPDPLTPGARRLATVALCAYLVVLAGVAFLPLPGEAPRGSLGVVPHQLALARPDLLGSWETQRNVLMTVPFGLLLPMVVRWRYEALLLACVGVTVVVETGQLLVSVLVGWAWRAFDVNDLLNNTLGGLIGLALTGAVLALLRRPRLPPAARLVPGATAAALVGWAVVATATTPPYAPPVDACAEAPVGAVTRLPGGVSAYAAREGAVCVQGPSLGDSTVTEDSTPGLLASIEDGSGGWAVGFARPGTGPVTDAQGRPVEARAVEGSDVLVWSAPIR